MSSFMGISVETIFEILLIICLISLIIVQYLERKYLSKQYEELTKQYEELKKEFEDLKEKYIVTKVAYKTISRHDPDLD